VDGRANIHGDNLDFHREYVDNERRDMHLVDDLPSQSTMDCASVVDNPAANFDSQHSHSRTWKYTYTGTH